MLLWLREDCEAEMDGKKLFKNPCKLSVDRRRIQTAH
jgi:hypothetical protein